MTCLTSKLKIFVYLDHLNAPQHLGLPDYISMFEMSVTILLCCSNALNPFVEEFDEVSNRRQLTEVFNNPVELFRLTFSRSSK